MSDGAAAPAPTPAVRVLVAEDEPHLGTLLEQFLAGRGHLVTLVRDGRAALDALRTGEFDVALTDVQMPGPDGLALLAAARALPFAPEVIVATGNAAGETAIRALRAGAYDAVAKPYRMAEVELLVQRAAEKCALRRLAAAAHYAATGDGPCDDPSLLALIPRLHDGAPAAPLLLLGESGTGRRTLARALHAAAARPGALVVADLATVRPDALRARLLDGVSGIPGLLALARHGTLCVAGAERLDPELLQAAIGRTTGSVALVMLSGSRAVLGEVGTALVERLGHRVCELQPLRARQAEVPALAARIASRVAGRPVRLDDDSAALLRRRAWPGNLAQLAAVVTAALSRSAPDADVLTPTALLADAE